MTDGLSLIWEL